MKGSELRKHCVCTLCRQRILTNAGVPLFWRVTVERFGIDLRAVSRQAGLEQMFMGNVGIAMAMGPDETMATPIMDPLTLTVCERCAITNDLPVAAMVDLAGRTLTEQTTAP